MQKKFIFYFFVDNAVYIYYDIIMKRKVLPFLLLVILSLSTAACGPSLTNVTNSSGDETFDITAYANTDMTVVIPFDTVCIEGFGGDGVFITDRVVALSAYSIGCYEVTQELFFAVMGKNPSHFISGPAENEKQVLRPVEWVSWYQAIAFCNKLSLKCKLRPYYIVEGVDFAELTMSDIPNETDDDWEAVTFDPLSDGYRLPTEAEWEFAARGGETSVAEWGCRFPTSNDWETCSWNEPNSDEMTHATGRLEPNTLGLYDCSGNVWEWCFDKYNPTVATGDYTDPTGDGTGDKRVLRGGCWRNDPDKCTVTYRASYLGYDMSQFIGFRLCRSILPTEEEEEDDEQ